MFTILFGILMVYVFGKMLFFGIRCTWGLARLFLSVVFLPVTLILMVMGGLLSLAFPILIIIGIGTLLLRD